LFSFLLFRNNNSIKQPQQHAKKWIAILMVLFLAQNGCLYYWGEQYQQQQYHTTTSTPQDRRHHEAADDLSSWEGHPFMGCDEIVQLQSTIGRKLGEGRHKVAYEVILSNGARAVAKRCKSQTCIRYERLRLEAEKNLDYQRRGASDSVVPIHGVCCRPYPPTTRRHRRRGQPQYQNDWTDLTRGHTVIYEPGEVLMKNWGEMVCHDCFASFFTEADVEDLRRIARSYSAAQILLHDLDEPYDTDNIYPTQYILTRFGGIRHADLDRANDCGDEPPQLGCPATEAALLEANCRVLVGGVARRDDDDNLDCSASYSAAHPVTDPTRRIDIAKARRHCHLDFYGFWLKYWLS
jgi:hypothetical protein